MNTKKTLSLILAFCFLFNIFGSNFTVSAKSLEVYDLVDELTEYVIVNEDGTLTISKEVKKIYGNQIYKEAKAMLVATNSMIENGYLTADKSGNLSFSDKYVDVIESKISSTDELEVSGNSATIRAVSGGVNKFVWTWYGFDLYIDNTICSYADDYGYTAAALAMFIPDVTISKVLALELSLITALIATNNNGDGVKIKWTCAIINGMPVVAPFWFSAQ